MPLETPGGEQIRDYSHLYSSFWQIFVSFQLDPKLDINFQARDARNMFATFVSLFEQSSLLNKHQFDLAPTEKAYSDFAQLPKFDLGEANEGREGLVAAALA